MKFKKGSLFIISLAFFLFVSYVIFIKPNRTRKVETFLRAFPKHEFKAKLLKSHPAWMEEQISCDFQGLAKNNITINYIDIIPKDAIFLKRRPLLKKLSRR